MTQSPTRIFMLRFLVITVLFALPAQAEIYKWTDEKGNVHYGDKPIVNSEEILIPEKINVQSRVTMQEREEKRKRLLESFAEDRADKKEQQEKQEIKKKKLNRQCITARDRLKTYQKSSRLYDLNEKGERVILSDMARQQAVNQLAAEIDKYCN